MIEQMDEALKEWRSKVTNEKKEEYYLLSQKEHQKRDESTSMQQHTYAHCETVIFYVF